MKILGFVFSLYFLSLAGAAAACVDVNTAPKEELEKIIHIGPSRAEQIIILRQEKLFSSVDDLDRVKGIGPSRIADIKQEGLACVQVMEPIVEKPIVEEPVIEKPTTTLPNAPLIAYPSGIIINEIMPSPKGPDETEEWIKILNQNNFEVDLSGWQITDIIGETNVYPFPAGTKISALGLLILNRPETKIILNNDGDGLKLIRPDGEIADSMNYGKAVQGQSSGPGAIYRGPTSVKTSAKEKPAQSPSDIGAGKGKGLAAASEPIVIDPGSNNSYPLLVALALAILSGFAILLLKKKKIKI